MSKPLYQREIEEILRSYEEEHLPTPKIVSTQEKPVLTPDAAGDASVSPRRRMARGVPGSRLRAGVLITLQLASAIIIAFVLFSFLGPAPWPVALLLLSAALLMLLIIWVARRAPGG
jgi:hypothetical protein